METEIADTPVPTGERLQKLRNLMASSEYNLQAYVIPSEDAHQSEYIAPCDGRRAFISGFDGSAGIAIVTTSSAYLFTDGRYFLQAEKQLDENWKLMKQGIPQVPKWQDFLIECTPQGSRIGIDPQLIGNHSAIGIKENLRKVDSQLVPISRNLIDLIWENRPAPPSDPISLHPVEYSGLDFSEKIQNIRVSLEKENAFAIIVSALDEVAWLFNLRGSDIPYNPVFFSYALVTKKSCTLYLDEKKITPEIRSSLKDVDIAPYPRLLTDLNELRIYLQSNKETLLINNRTSWAVVESVGQEYVKEARSPVMDAKSIKNNVELEGMKQCHIRDAAALCNYFAWLENELVNNNKDGKITESEGADKLESFRRQQEKIVGLSFTTISSSGPNAAVIHYSPTRGFDRVISTEEIYLCDSGGQYLDGTTDVTRTLHFGKPTDWEKEAFTRVLKGHIALDRVVFPTGTTGYQLDAFARSSLWETGLDYLHGTGHGVGSFLNVHEGPQSISPRVGSNAVPLKEGMTVTNEPGYYEDGNFGIRIENVLLVTKADTQFRFGNKDYLKFERATVVPIRKNLLKMDLLSEEEQKWINDYHAECFEKVSPLLEKDGLGYQWLRKETSPL